MFYNLVKVSIQIVLPIFLLFLVHVLLVNFLLINFIFGIKSLPSYHLNLFILLLVLSRVQILISLGLQLLTNGSEQRIVCLKHIHSFQCIDVLKDILMSVWSLSAAQNLIYIIETSVVVISIVIWIKTCASVSFLQWFFMNTEIWHYESLFGDVLSLLSCSFVLDPFVFEEALDLEVLSVEIALVLSKCDLDWLKDATN